MYSDIQEDDEKLDKYYTIGNVFFVFHLLLLKSFIPAITVSLAVLRNTLDNLYEDNHFIKGTFVILFVFIFVSGLIFAESWQLALPASVSLIMTFGFLFTKGNMLTVIIGICSILWLIVGFHLNSYSIIALETLSVFLLFYRFYKQNS